MWVKLFHMLSVSMVEGEWAEVCSSMFKLPDASRRFKKWVGHRLLVSYSFFTERGKQHSQLGIPSSS
ncbi:MAG TPA: hypothetical protein VMT12_07795, partial [Syntrophales bacterium]|nr:hypothetical protein [Syntrophales bacterium]